MSLRSCAYCGALLFNKRRDARFCCGACRAAAARRSREAKEAHRSAHSGSRRPSRDGFGTRIYFTPHELADLRWLAALGPDALSKERLEGIRRKAEAAEARIGRKEAA